MTTANIYFNNGFNKIQKENMQSRQNELLATHYQGGPQTDLHVPGQIKLSYFKVVTHVVS